MTTVKFETGSEGRWVELMNIQDLVRVVATKNGGGGGDMPSQLDLGPRVDWRVHDCKL